MSDAAMQPREPSMLQALMCVGVLVGLLSMTVVLFGVDAAVGPLQLALFLSAAFAAVVAAWNGHSWDSLRDAAVLGVSSAMSAIFILLAVGALIGTWNMVGTIPTLVSYGIAFLSAKWFYLATAIICAAVGAVTGSSWTTAGTLGVAFVGMAPILGASPPIAAGAVISGAYFGDKMSPLSETTILVPQLVGGVTTSEHIKGMLWTSGPAFGLAVVVFAIMGFTAPAQGAVDVSVAQDALRSAYNISLVALLPLAVLGALTLRKVPPFLALLGSALFAGVLAAFTQPQAVSAFVGRPELGSVGTPVAAIFMAMANGFKSASGNETIDALFTAGGMSVMLSTIWLILGALSFGAVMESAGFLATLMRPLITRAKAPRGLIASVVATAFGLNVLAGDQYVADVLPCRAYRGVFRERGIAGHVLSRAVEDSGTVTSVLIPWNSCGAYISTVLGVATVAYLPYCIFNLASPIIEIVLIGLIGFKLDRLDEAAPEGRAPSPRGTPHAYSKTGEKP